MQLSVKGEGYFSKSLPRNAISWVSGRRPAARETVPRTIFDRMFRRGVKGLPDRSVLDLVLEDAKGLKLNISPADRHKVEEYLESIRAVERRLAFRQATASTRV